MQPLGRIICEAAQPLVAVAQFDKVALGVVLVPTKEEYVCRLMQRLFNDTPTSIVIETLFQGARQPAFSHLPGLVIFELHRTARRLQATQVAVSVIDKLNDLAGGRAPFDPASERVVFVLDGL